MAARRSKCTMSVFTAVFLLAAFPAALGSHELIFTHVPSYMKFLKAGSIKTSEIPKMVSLAMGLSVPTGMKWNGLAESTVIKRPKASVLITIPGFDKSADTTLKIHHNYRYPVTHNQELNTEIVANNLQGNFFDQDPLIVDFSAENTVYDLKSRHPRLFNNLSPTLSKLIMKAGDTSSLDIGSLNVTKEADGILLAELQLIQEILTSIEKNRKLVDDKVPDLFSFKVSGLQKLVLTYGTQSQQVEDALRILQTFLVKVTEEFKKLYKNNVLVQVITAPSVDAYEVRKTRSLLATAEKATELNPLNLDAEYDPDYPVIFNIVLGMFIVFVVLLYAIIYGLINMDPGHDSIIYRMTSQRIKMD